MSSKKLMALAAAAALAACLAFAGCGGTQAASSSAASASAESSPAASASAATEDASASSAAATESSAAASATAAASAAASSEASYIGDQAAMDIALKDAGFAASDVTELEVELDLDDAVAHYDIGFKQGGMEYDYDIDATSGAIINSNSEVDD